MKDSGKRFWEWVACGVLTGFTLVACGPAATVPEGDFGSEGELPLAEPFLLPDLNGTKVSLDDYRGNLVLLDLFATWCAPCLEEIPRYNRLLETYRDQGFRIVGVAVQSGWAEDIAPTVTEHDIQYPVLVGNDDIMRAYRVIGYPTAYLIDENGAVREKFLGTVPGKEGTLEDAIQRLLAEEG